MALMEVTVDGFDFELDIPEGFTITGAALLLKGENTEGETLMACDTDKLNWLERLGIYTWALDRERAE